MQEAVYEFDTLLLNEKNKGSKCNYLNVLHNNEIGDIAISSVTACKLAFGVKKSDSVRNKVR